MSKTQTDPLPAVTAVPTVVIEPRRSWSLGLRSLWSHRELTYFLAVRDVRLRYKQTFFGAGWALIQPIMLMVAVSALFTALCFGVWLSALNVPYRDVSTRRVLRKRSNAHRPTSV